MELCEINILGLERLEEKYRKLQADITIVDDKKSKLFKYASVVKEDNYCTYTKNHSENNKVVKLKKFIKSLNEIEEFTTVFPASIQQGLSNAVRYDISENEYVISEFS